MNKIVIHKKPKQGTKRLNTLGDLRDFISTCDIPQNKKAQIRSAIKRVDKLIGHGALDFPANLPEIMQQLDSFTPEMAEVSAGTFANLKSRLRGAFVLANGHLVSPQVRYPLTGQWKYLQQAIPAKAQRNLSRLFHYAAQQGWEPQDINDSHIKRFSEYLREAGIVRYEAVVANTIRTWNRIVDSKVYFDLQTLIRPPLKRTSYWVPEAKWPDSLRCDVAAFLTDLSAPSPFTGQRVRPVKSTTVQQYRNAISTLIAGAVCSGIKLSTLQELKDIVRPEVVNKALLFLTDRNEEKITAHMVQIAMRARSIASRCGLPEAEQKQLNQIFLSVKEHSNQRKGMTAKNRALLDRLDDRHFNDLVLILPRLLFEKGKAQRNIVWGAAMIRTALAIDLLLTCSMRRENLVSLKLGESIKRIGSGSDQRWVIELVSGEVKNGDPLRYELPVDTVELLEAYLSDWRPKLFDVANFWLFPSPNGTQINSVSLAEAIRTCSKRVLGVAITPHQFRHLSAEIYLRANPDALFTISQHLGHRDPNTTRTYYARPKQREATRRYQEHVLNSRNEAHQRIKIKKVKPANLGPASFT